MNHPNLDELSDRAVAHPIAPPRPLSEVERAAQRHRCRRRILTGSAMTSVAAVAALGAATVLQGGQGASPPSAGGEQAIEGSPIVLLDGDADVDLEDNIEPEDLEAIEVWEDPDDAWNRPAGPEDELPAEMIEARLTMCVEDASGSNQAGDASAPPDPLICLLELETSRRIGSDGDDLAWYAVRAGEGVPGEAEEEPTIDVMVAAVMFPVDLSAPRWPT